MSACMYELLVDSALLRVVWVVRACTDGGLQGLHNFRVREHVWMLVKSACSHIHV